MLYTVSPQNEPSYSVVQVEIQVDLEELEEHLESEEQGAMFDIDPFDTVVGQEGEDSDSEGEDDDDEGDNLSDLSSDAGGDPDYDEDQEDVATDFKHIQDMVNKLDSILKVIFDHFNQSHAVHDPVLAPLPSTPSSRPDSPGLLTPSVEHPRPLGVVVLLHGPHGGDPRVVDQHVEAAETCDGAVHRLGRRRAIGDVGSDGEEAFRHLGGAIEHDDGGIVGAALGPQLVLELSPTARTHRQLAQHDGASDGFGISLRVRVRVRLRRRGEAPVRRHRCSL